MNTFVEKLKEAGMTKAALAKEFAMNPRTVSAWGNNPPRYAVAYLDMRIRCKNLLKKLEGE